jgi:hypothetical protein
MKEGFRVVADPSFKEMRDQLRAVDRKWAKELQKRNKKIAVWVADAVEADYNSEHAPQSGEGAKSIRARSSQTDASVWMGSEAAPYVLGQNFGSNQGPDKEQFPDRKEPDYFLYQNISDNFGRIQKEHLQGVDEVFEEAFPD